MSGFSGLLTVLRIPGSPVSALLWLYLMLTAVALTVVCIGIAVADIVRRITGPAGPSACCRGRSRPLRRHLPYLVKDADRTGR